VQAVLYPLPVRPATFTVQIDQDFHGWLLEQVSALRDQRISSLDLEHLAEELEAMAKSDERALASQLRRLLEDLLKWQFLPSRRGASWERTATDARDQIRDLMDESPSLEKKLPTILQKVYPRARRDTLAVAKRIAKVELLGVSETFPWPFEMCMQEDFWPSEPPAPPKH